MNGGFGGYLGMIWVYMGCLWIVSRGVFGCNMGVYGVYFGVFLGFFRGNHDNMGVFEVIRVIWCYLVLFEGYLRVILRCFGGTQG